MDSKVFKVRLDFKDLLELEYRARLVFKEFKVKLVLAFRANKGFKVRLDCRAFKEFRAIKVTKVVKARLVFKVKLDIVFKEKLGFKVFRVTKELKVKLVLLVKLESKVFRD